MDPARRRRRRRWLITGLALLAGPFLAEGLLRWLLFSDSELARALGAKYRDPFLYVHDTAAPEYKGIEYLLQEPAARWRARHPHPTLGWVADPVDPETLRHEDEAHLGGRRPVLLYGTSFARCTFLTTCFEDYLERAGSGAGFGLLNYAATGYGLDQVRLLLDATLDQHAAQRPVVVISFVVESDLDRCMMSFFSGPKPHFEGAQDGYDLVLPDELDPDRFLERHPPVRSYFARYLVHGLRFLPESARGSLAGVSELAAQRRLLWKHLLTSMRDSLDGRGVEYFMLLFHTQGAAEGTWFHADDPELRAFLLESGMPYVDSRAEVGEALAGGASVGDLYVRAGRGEGHPTERGTEVLFAALVRGLERRFEGELPIGR